MMLTKDLINAKVTKGELRLQFLSPHGDETVGLAEEVLRFLADGRGERYGEVLKRGEAEFGKRDKVARGLLNVAMNWAEQVDTNEFDADARFDWFTVAEEVRNEGLFSDVHAFRAAVATRLGVSDGDLSNLLYSDIEENRLFEPNASLTAATLINEYNVCSVQFFLLSADHLIIDLRQTEIESYRSLIRYIRFHELYAESIDAQSDGFSLRISGAGAVLGTISRSGKKLANFLGEILNAEGWHLQVPALYKGRKAVLKVSSHDGLMPRHRRTRSYVPQELKEFSDRLKENLAGQWDVVVNTALVNVGSGSPVLPDLQLVGVDGKIFYLEFFHRWHGGTLLDRMDSIQKCGMKNYVVAVESSLAEKGRTKSKLDEFTKSGHFCLEYRDFPTISSVRDLVNSAR